MPKEGELADRAVDEWRPEPCVDQLNKLIPRRR
jgi:hypothetical protein